MYLKKSKTIDGGSMSLFAKKKMCNSPTLKLYGPEWTLSETLGYVSTKDKKNSIIICNNYTILRFVKKLKRSIAQTKSSKLV
jgi:hypothetical protein